MDVRTERHTELTHLRRTRFGAQTCDLFQETLAAAEADSTSTQPG